MSQETYYLGETREGRWADKVGDRQAEYESFFAQDNPYAALDDIALIDMRIAMLLERSEGITAGVPPASWEVLRRMVDNVTDAHAANEEKKMGKLIRILSRAVDRGMLEATVWSEIEELVDKRANMSVKVRKEEQVREQHMTLLEAQRHISQAVQAVVMAATAVLESQSDKELVAQAALTRFKELESGSAQ